MTSQTRNPRKRIRVWHLVLAGSAFILLAAGWGSCSATTEPCWKGNGGWGTVRVRVAAAPGLVEPEVDGTVYGCIYLCEGDPVDAPTCTGLLGMLWLCDRMTEFPKAREFPLGNGCQPVSDVLPGYVLVFVDPNRDWELSPGEAYGLTAHDGGPGDRDLDLAVLIDMVYP